MLLTDSMSEAPAVTELHEEDDTTKEQNSKELEETAILWFSANSKYGVVNIGLIRDKKSSAESSVYTNTVLEYVLALIREESMVQLLEDWLQVGLDLRPIKNIDGDYHTLTISNRNSVANNVNSNIIIKVNSETLANLPIPDWNTQEELTIESSCIAAYLCLSSETIGQKYIDLITTDSVLLIPESFSKVWIGYTKAKDFTSSTTILKIEDDLKRLEIDNETHLVSPEESNQQNSSTNSLQVVIEEDIDLPLHLLLGWSNKGNYILKKTLSYYSVTIKHAQTIVATGRLVPVSNGYGIYINTIS